jgi:hypothetical protein
VINSLQNATAGADQWVFDEKKALQAVQENKSYPVPFYRYQRDAGQTTISYRTGESTQLDARAALKLYEEIKTSSAKSIDIILDIFSHLSRNMNNDGSAWFFASEHLDHRGITPITKEEKGSRRRAGHRKEDMEDIHQALVKLQNLWLTIEQRIDTDEIERPSQKGTKPRRKKRMYTHTGRLLMIDEMWYQNELGEESANLLENGVPIGWHIHTGDWLRTFLEAPNYQVAQLCDTLLHYDPYRQRWAKAIGIYLMFHGHMQCRGKGGILTRIIGGIIDETSLPIDTDDPARTRKRFENAMNQLAKDNVIDGWEYESKITLPRKQWLDKWLDHKVKIYIAAEQTKLKG